MRYYERAGLFIAVSRNAGGQRRYSAADVEWLQFLLRLRATGMPIADMRRYAILRAEASSTVAARLVLLQAHEEALAQRNSELRAHQRALRDKIATYQQSLASPVEG